MKNKLLGIFQIIVTVFFIYYTLSKIGLNKILEVIKSADLLFILFASIVYFLSQIISSERLWFILKENNLIISSKENIKLYMVGIFYNFFIPGGVGGDAYKGVLMNKKFQWSLKKIYKLLILDRLIGFGVILCLITVFSGFILDLEFISEFNFVLAPLYALLFFVGRVLVQKIFNNEIVYTKAFFISHIIQILQFGSIVLILFSLGVTNNYFTFLYIFLISSVLSIFSFGGIGIREYVFFTLASNTAVGPDIATSVGLIFTFSALISSVPGLFFLIKIKSKKKLST
ncbi:flippase-like domain-containing protein [Flavobacteriales bacterium]|nr:flippase-like domain-containing protein [Flavobacteriales bacterium]